MEISRLEMISNEDASCPCLPSYVTGLTRFSRRGRAADGLLDE